MTAASRCSGGNSASSSLCRHRHQHHLRSVSICSSDDSSVPPPSQSSHMRDGFAMSRLVSGNDEAASLVDDMQALRIEIAALKLQLAAAQAQLSTVAVMPVPPPVVDAHALPGHILAWSCQGIGRPE